MTEKVFVIAPGVLKGGWYFRHPADGSHTGPFRTKREAELALSAIETVTPLRKAGKKPVGSTPGSFASIPDFTDEPERRQWITEHAEYFTVIRARLRTERKREREEYPTLEAATARAEELIKRNPRTRYLIYAVYGPHDTWVKTVSK